MLSLSSLKSSKGKLSKTKCIMHIKHVCFDVIILCFCTINSIIHSSQNGVSSFYFLLVSYTNFLTHSSDKKNPRQRTSISQIDIIIKLYKLRALILSDLRHERNKSLRRTHLRALRLDVNFLFFSHYLINQLSLLLCLFSIL